VSLTSAPCEPKFHYRCVVFLDFPIVLTARFTDNLHPEESSVWEKQEVRTGTLLGKGRVLQIWSPHLFVSHESIQAHIWLSWYLCSLLDKSKAVNRMRIVLDNLQHTGQEATPFISVWTALPRTNISPCLPIVPNVYFKRVTATEIKNSTHRAFQL